MVRERHKGNPLLILLENYVMDCIEPLSKEKTENIREIGRR